MNFIITNKPLQALKPTLYVMCKNCTERMRVSDPLVGGAYGTLYTQYICVYCAKIYHVVVNGLIQKKEQGFPLRMSNESTTALITLGIESIGAKNWGFEVNTVGGGSSSRVIYTSASIFNRYQIGDCLDLSGSV